MQLVRSSRVGLAMMVGLGLVFLLVTVLVHHQLGQVDADQRGGDGDEAGDGHEDDLRPGQESDRLLREAARRTLGLAAAFQLGDAGGDDNGVRSLSGRISEERRVLQSVRNELRALEKDISELQRQKQALLKEMDSLTASATQARREVERLTMKAHQLELREKEFERRNTPEIRGPLSLDHLWPNASTVSRRRQRGEDVGTDLSSCALHSGFPLFVYPSTSAGRLLGTDLTLTASPDRACLRLAVVSGSADAAGLSSLSHWGTDGLNHLIIFSDPDVAANRPESSRAAVAHTELSHADYRPGVDLILPHLSRPLADVAADDVWRHTGRLLPVHRTYLVSFEGAWIGDGDSAKKNAVHEKVLTVLREINADQTDDKVWIDTDCTVDAASPKDFRGEWGLCHDVARRAQQLQASTFALLFAPPPHLVSSRLFQARLHEALQHGAIPVVLGGVSARDDLMPFAETIDWKRAAFVVPTARIPELHLFLRAFPDSDLFAKRRQGNLIWRHYLATPQLAVRAGLNVLRERLNMPPPVLAATPSPSVFARPPMLFTPEQQEPPEMLGVVEPPRSSPAFRRNFTSVFDESSRRWNEHFNPFHLAPSTPWEPLLPSDAKFLGSPRGFRPIGDGAGGAGHEFSQALGGNSPAEQFTVVMLTYEREKVLMDSLQRLHNLPFLNKVVVVWNSPEPPSPELEWPDIGVPVAVVRTEKNSLNNRFLPYDAIETEAVLSVDDDAHLRHDEIVFGFRVWRENRDRMVGFPGRFHAWDVGSVGGGWNYDSNYSCELSMVLTGAAFYHNYYNYAYSQLMPQAVRDKVDEYMNCEDLAMNFLISHTTRTPPVKVTSRWTFRCPNCPVSLSENDLHFVRRSKCINFFAEVYGYMPLLYTQFRADSVLFKTRIPQDKQKCFKFI